MAACQDRSSLSIGDSYPRATTGPTIYDVVQIAIDSMPPGRAVGFERAVSASGPPTAQAAAMATRFVGMPNVVGVVNFAGSREALIAASIFNLHGLPQLVPNGTSQRLGTAGPWTYSLVPNDSVEGAFLASDAIDSLHTTRVSLFYVGNEYGTGLRDGLRSALRAHDRELVDAAMVSNDGCASDLTGESHRLTTLAALRRARPDAVVIAAATGTATCLARIIAAASPTTWILSGDGLLVTAPAVAALDDVTRAQMRSVEFWEAGADSASTLFEARWRRVFQQEPSSVDALNYDAFLLLATAAREGGGTRDGVRRWLESLGRRRPPLAGATGPLSVESGRVGARLRMVPMPPRR